jgi:hypothetical protein
LEQLPAGRQTKTLINQFILLITVGTSELRTIIKQNTDHADPGGREV